jgi:hypothetical protein
VSADAGLSSELFPIADYLETGRVGKTVGRDVARVSHEDLVKETAQLFSGRIGAGSDPKAHRSACHGNGRNR